MAPVRTCIGCRRPTGAAELVRIVALPDGTLGVGPNRPGRGAWLHTGSAECFERAARRSAFSRALRVPVAPAAVEALQGSRTWEDHALIIKVRKD